MKSEYLIRSVYAVFLCVSLYGGAGNAFDEDRSNVGSAELSQGIKSEEFSPAMLKLDQVASRSRDAVPMETLEKVADIHARVIWGAKVARGDPLQIVDSTGEPVMYAFPIALGESSIPSTGELLKQFSKYQGADGRLAKAEQRYPSELNGSVNKALGHYGTIYVSARKSDYPVRRVSHALHPYFYYAKRALLSIDPKLRGLMKLRYLPPYEFFEFRNEDSMIRVHSHTLMNEKEIRRAAEKFTAVSEIKAEKTTGIAVNTAKIAAAWSAYEEPSHEVDTPSPGPLPYEFRIYQWRRIAVIDWTRWCEPTAVAMVFSYWDHYMPVPMIGGNPNYSRLVDYWFDHPSNGHNVPDIIDPIADGLNIDVPNILKGYNWSVDKVIGDSNNDFAWNELVGHLRINHPVVWQVHGAINHAVAAFGYKIVNGQKYVLLYNTWSADPVAAFDEWLYDDWTSVEVDRYRPGGEEPHRYLFVRQPNGGETFLAGEWNRILFYLHAQTDIKKIRIEYSLDGGLGWSLIVETWAQPGLNTWWWKPMFSSNRARIRIKGMAEDHTYLGGDGSFNNFTIQ